MGKQGKNLEGLLGRWEGIEPVKDRGDGVYFICFKTTFVKFLGTQFYHYKL
jgi:hypothetical protein